MTSIDVAIPCYGYGRYLAACVESVLGQGLEACRILIIDNASPDDSLAIARRLAAENRNVAVVAHGRNLGHTASFNEAVDWARSDYFAILCADDLLAPGALRRASAILDAHPRAAFVHGGEIAFGRDGPPPAPPPAPSGAVTVTPGTTFISNSCRAPMRFIHAGTMVVRTAAQKRAGHFSPQLPYTDDLEMILRLAMLGDVVETQAVQAFRRLHGSNMSEGYDTQPARRFEHRAAAFESFFARLDAAVPPARPWRASMRRGMRVAAARHAVRRIIAFDAADGAALARFALSMRLPAPRTDAARDEAAGQGGLAAHRR